MVMGEILLVRHGETNWNREGRFRGLADVPLNENGLFEADATAQRIAREWTLAALYSSPIRRARQTAEIIGALTGQEIRIVNDLADVDFGEWQGLTGDEAAQRDPAVMHLYREVPSRARIPGGETFIAAGSRAYSALAAIALAHDRETVAVVAHTEINRLIILAAMRASIDCIWRLGQGTCAINLLRFHDGVIDVVSVNDRCHLTQS